MKRNQRRKLLLPTSIVLVIASIIYGVIWDMRNPFDEVTFIEDRPGATSRHVTFTPVLKSDPDTIIGPTFGADYGELKYEDVDGDGIHEAIIETDVPIFSGEFYTAERHVLKFVKLPSGGIKIVHLKTDALEDTYTP